MKASVKLQDHHQQQQNHHPPPLLLLRAKIPISIFNLPFLSHFSTTTTTTTTTTQHPSNLSLALSTNFTSGPSVKLSYATAANTSPLTLTLKSGTGLFGSPNNSPLTICAHFSFNPSNPNNPNPTFSLLFKPQLGSFSLRKSTFSHSKTDQPANGDSGFDSNSFGFVPLERPDDGVVKDLSVGTNYYKDSIFKGVQLTANTQLPVARKTALNLRWRMDFPGDNMPALRINKIGIERVVEVVKDGDDDDDDERRKKKKNEGSNGEVEMLKGMCFWMKKELDTLTRVNGEMKSELADIKAVRVVKNGAGGMEFREGIRKKAMPSVVSTSGGFEQWRSKKNNGGNVSEINEENKNGSLAIDVENELQRAIKAAASSSS